MRDVFRRYFISINLGRSLTRDGKTVIKQDMLIFALGHNSEFHLTSSVLSQKYTTLFGTFPLFLHESFSAFLPEMILMIREEGVVKSFVFTAVGHIAVDGCPLRWHHL
jgi:hypothetical protein